MNTLWLENKQLSFRSDIEPTTPGVDEVLVKVRLAGICTTDLEMVKGYYEFTGIPGHEFVGEVVDAPSAKDLVGKRIVADINVVCGKCESCLTGHGNHCENRTVIGIKNRNGVFGEYITLPLANLNVIPDTVEDEIAVFVEPLAAADRILEQVHVQPGMKVLVIGAGRLGILCAMVLFRTGCDLKVVVRQPKTKKILESTGITTITTQDVKPNMADMVVEVTGTSDGFLQAREALREEGTLVLKSTFSGNSQINLSSLVVDEIKLVGSRCGTFHPAIRLLETGQIDPTPMIDATFRLKDGLEAYTVAGQRGILKVLLRP